MLTEQKISKDSKKFIAKVIFTSGKFKIKICNILQKHFSYKKKWPIKNKKLFFYYTKSLPTNRKVQQPYYKVRNSNRKK